MTLFELEYHLMALIDHKLLECEVKRCRSGHNITASGRRGSSSLNLPVLGEKGDLLFF